ncbi:hypothetical protein [Amycolatopsis sp. cmx-4-68]|uniref:hypothetical protein n=1 Tax=Amycolatopsis sp. cmx-4-68 TaxID=2790938 RepID=UPI00397A6EC1
MDAERIATPSKWVPLRVADMRGDLPLEVPEDSWIRMLDEPERGYPFLHLEVAWITPVVLHVAVIAGFSAAPIPGDDGRDERAVVDHRRVSLETIARLKLSLAPDGQDIVELVTGERFNDWPTMLIQQYLAEHP